MIPPDEALSLIASAVKPLASRKVSLLEGAGCCLATPLVAAIDSPPFENSAMDGYAVRAADLLAASNESPVALKLLGEAPAGAGTQLQIKEGETVRILTGGPVPDGADAVVQQEHAEKAGNKVLFSRPARRSDNIRPRGEDVKAGEGLLPKGAVLRPHEIGLLASQGLLEAEVVPRPKAMVLVTGSELVSPGAPLGPGKIYNSNGPALVAALQRWFVETVDLGHVPDDEKAIGRVIAGASGECDLLLVSGGVSVGDYDYTRRALDSLGFEEIFWKVAVKPGKPLLFGRLPARKGRHAWVFGLPGNPLSSLVCLEEFVRPAIERMQGRASGHPSYHMRGRALNAYPKPKERQQFVFCRAEALGDEYVLSIIRPQGSAMLKMATGANALAVAPVGTALVREGDLLPFRWLK